MDDLFFPQLSSGALVQYPLRKTKIVRNITNALPDGTFILQPDPDASRTMWQMIYQSLSFGDVDSLATFFNSCQGRLKPFTFIDPSDNMLRNSANLISSPWQSSSLLHCKSGLLDPTSGLCGFGIENTGQSEAECIQTVAVPTNYQYCFSIYAQSNEPAKLQLIRRGVQTDAIAQLPIGPQWTRLVTNGQLEEPGSTFTVGISLAPGQQVRVFGPQLEAQIAPSRYSSTVADGGVYSNAHWAIDELKVTADGPGLFSTTLSIEANK